MNEKDVATFKNVAITFLTCKITFKKENTTEHNANVNHNITSKSYFIRK